MSVKWQDIPANFETDGKLYLVRCPSCKRENYAMAVATGTCAWCGWDPYFLGKWTDEHFNKATSEGWVLSLSKGSAHGPLQIQKLDQAYKFEEDDDVWRHVVKRAKDKTSAAFTALEIIKEVNPEEYERIHHHT